MFGFFKALTGSGSTSREQEPCNLWIGGHPNHLHPVDDPQGLGAYQLAIEALIRDESPEVIYLRSDTEDLSVVCKALEYLSRIGGQVGVADQLPDEEVAAIFGVDVRSYQSAVVNPQGDAAAFVDSRILS
ncbi:hypothetical protein HF289_02405 [Acidithiobacillus ferrooxidans]|uniref:hypothetical protein n=1 Tax=Acidithiobacillus ferrooxidans TaxID=920 RepID=UPI001C066E07|nr:hypothetical protein [Acidithiobacillus ferrooxidans]MBU2855762.1 hypothetical protein [Acidithiobacillus ferrooxidans]MBU2861475.1 hypothetical protein [Acidithiobacillus ferrooxidans]